VFTCASSASLLGRTLWVPERAQGSLGLRMAGRVGLLVRVQAGAGLGLGWVGKAQMALGLGPEQPPLDASLFSSRVFRVPTSGPNFHSHCYFSFIHSSYVALR